MIEDDDDTNYNYTLIIIMIIIVKHQTVSYNAVMKRRRAMIVNLIQKCREFRVDINYTMPMQSLIFQHKYYKAQAPIKSCENVEQLANYILSFTLNVVFPFTCCGVLFSLNRRRHLVSVLSQGRVYFRRYCSVHASVNYDYTLMRQCIYCGWWR